jgi:hypothetical protein
MLIVTATFAWPADEGDGFWIARSRKLYSVVGGLSARTCSSACS